MPCTSAVFPLLTHSLAHFGCCFSPGFGDPQGRERSRLNEDGSWETGRANISTNDPRNTGLCFLASSLSSWHSLKPSITTLLISSHLHSSITWLHLPLYSQRTQGNQRKMSALFSRGLLLSCLLFFNRNEMQFCHSCDKNICVLFAVLWNVILKKKMSLFY